MQWTSENRCIYHKIGPVPPKSAPNKNKIGCLLNFGHFSTWVFLRENRPFGLFGESRRRLTLSTTPTPTQSTNVHDTGIIISPDGFVSYSVQTQLRTSAETHFFNRGLQVTAVAQLHTAVCDPYFWPDWNSCERQGVFIIFSTKGTTYIYFLSPKVSVSNS